MAVVIGAEPAAAPAAGQGVELAVQLFADAGTAVALGQDVPLAATLFIEAAAAIAAGQDVLLRDGSVVDYSGACNLRVAATSTTLWICAVPSSLRIEPVPAALDITRCT